MTRHHRDRRPRRGQPRPSRLVAPLALVLIGATASLAAGRPGPSPEATGSAVPAVTDSFIVVGGDTLFVVAPVAVPGDRVAAALPGATRPVAVQDADALATAPVRAIPDALATEAAVVTGQRQAWGVQSDLSIRGSTFEQVRVLLDGVDVSDPQTGHHSLNLPLALQDIARVEILPGHGSLLLGGGAPGGTVNVIPVAPARGTVGEVGAMGGPDGTWAVRGSVDLSLDDPAPAAVEPRSPIGDHGRGLRASARRFRTDGHEVDGAWSGRDADLATATLRYLDAAPGRRSDVFVGWADRRFGARDFYSPTSGHEETSTLVLTARHRHQLGRVVLEPRVAGRRHRDRFTLWRESPDRYRNRHVSRRLLTGVRASVPLTDRWTLAGDLEGVYEDLDSDGIRDGAPSPALGDRVRRQVGGALQLARHGLRWRLQLGGRVDLRDQWSPRAQLAAAAAWQPRPAWTVHASTGSVHRVPTFTERHYEDPYNRADPDLAPERTWAWDAGVRLDDGRWLAAATTFARHEDDVIDWVRAPGDTVWVVRNAAEGRVRGLELQAGWRHGAGHALALGYQYLHKDLDLPAGAEAKYALVVPRHHLTGRASLVLSPELELAVTGRWLERTGGDAPFAEVVVLAARLTLRRGPWTLRLDGQNLGDRRYAEIPGAIMPGRSVFLSAAHRF